MSYNETSLYYISTPLSENVCVHVKTIILFIYCKYMLLNNIKDMDILTAYHDYIRSFFSTINTSFHKC